MVLPSSVERCCLLHREVCLRYRQQPAEPPNLRDRRVARISAKAHSQTYKPDCICTRSLRAQTFIDNSSAGPSVLLWISGLLRGFGYTSVLA